MRLAFLFVLLVGVLATAYRECPADQVEMLLTFHPHMDAFWLNTEEQLTDINFRPAGFLYDMNQRNSKQIYNSMYDALVGSNSSGRRYFTTEVFFFRDWYDWLEPNKREKVKEMIKTGRLELANAGWVENDEAICYYDDIIEQYTVGMNFMYEEFGQVSRVGWATDCFGHSHSQAALLNQLGFEMQGIERFDERYIYEHKETPELEFYWKTKSDSNNITYGGLMTHLRYFLHEPNMFRRGTGIVEELQGVIPIMKKLYGNKVLFRFFGNDFEEYLPIEFDNLQKAMKTINDQTKCDSIHYGNPTEFMEKNKRYFKNNEVKTREFDLMPDWDQGHYWTGYYTTYPELKKVCKDYSRLLNFFKKSLLKSYSHTPSTTLDTTLKQLLKFQQLNAILQHHDGITATSKHHIQVSMINKVKKAEIQIKSLLNGIHSIKDMVECNIHTNNYECRVNDNVTNDFTLALYSEGTERVERVEVVLVDGSYFKVVGGNTQYAEAICYERNGTACRIVTEVHVRPGTTVLKFQKIEAEEFTKSAKLPFETTTTQQFKFNDITLKILNDSVIQHSFGGGFINISYVFSQSIQVPRQVQSWNKYGSETKKTEYMKSGLYLMSNNGKLMNYGGIATKTNFITTDKFARLIIQFRNVKSIITISKDQPLALDILTEFQPDRDLRDYFIRFQSSVQGNNEFFHDANGYLVMKRVFDQRPDYTFQPVEDDKINANTYPTTAFAYIKNDTKKMAVWIDRAQGVAIYGNDSLLSNIERLTSEDGKGAAEGYQYVTKSVFRHKVAIVDIKHDIERMWQKQYDEAILGYYGAEPTVQSVQSNPINENSKYLKLTTAFLNSHSLVIRIQNLAEFKSITVPLFSGKKLTLSDFGLELEFYDLMESYHNGIPIYNTYKWKASELEEGVVDIHKNRIDASGKIELKPLQIRSFRVDLKSEINKNPPQTPPIAKQVSQDSGQQTTHLTRHSGIRRSGRCF